MIGRPITKRRADQVYEVTEDLAYISIHGRLGAKRAVGMHEVDVLIAISA